MNDSYWFFNVRKSIIIWTTALTAETKILKMNENAAYFFVEQKQQFGFTHTENSTVVVRWKQTTFLIDTCAVLTTAHHNHSIPFRLTFHLIMCALYEWGPVFVFVCDCPINSSGVIYDMASFRYNWIWLLLKCAQKNVFNKNNRIESTRIEVQT